MGLFAELAPEISIAPVGSFLSGIRFPFTSTWDSDPAAASGRVIRTVQVPDLDGEYHPSYWLPVFTTPTSGESKRYESSGNPRFRFRPSTVNSNPTSLVAE